VNILPFGFGVHPVLQGMLSLMWFEDQPPTAYSEGAYVGKLHDSPSVVERLQAIYDLALSDALPQQESLALLRTTAKDYRHDDRAHNPGRRHAGGLA
jgi:hypothetical protein